MPSCGSWERPWQSLTYSTSPMVHRPSRRTYLRHLSSGFSVSSRWLSSHGISSPPPARTWRRCAMSPIPCAGPRTYSSLVSAPVSLDPCSRGREPAPSLDPPSSHPFRWEAHWPHRRTRDQGVYPCHGQTPPQPLPTHPPRPPQPRAPTRKAAPLRTRTPQEPHSPGRTLPPRRSRRRQEARRQPPPRPQDSRGYATQAMPHHLPRYPTQHSHPEPPPTCPRR